MSTTTNYSPSGSQSYLNQQLAIPIKKGVFQKWNNECNNHKMQVQKSKCSLNKQTWENEADSLTEEEREQERGGGVLMRSEIVWKVEEGR